MFIITVCPKKGGTVRLKWLVNATTTDEAWTIWNKLTASEASAGEPMLRPDEAPIMEPVEWTEGVCQVW